MKKVYYDSTGKYGICTTNCPHIFPLKVGSVGCLNCIWFADYDYDVRGDYVNCTIDEREVDHD